MCTQSNQRSILHTKGTSLEVQQEPAITEVEVRVVPILVHVLKQLWVQDLIKHKPMNMRWSNKHPAAGIGSANNAQTISVCCFYFAHMLDTRLSLPVWFLPLASLYVFYLNLFENIAPSQVF